MIFMRISLNTWIVLKAKGREYITMQNKISLQLMPIICRFLKVG